MQEYYVPSLPGASAPDLPVQIDTRRVGWHDIIGFCARQFRNFSVFSVIY